MRDKTDIDQLDGKKEKARNNVTGFLLAIDTEMPLALANLSSSSLVHQLAEASGFFSHFSVS